METKFRNRYRISNARLKGWDYGGNGWYFITICTKNRIHYFGKIHPKPVETQNIASLQKTIIGLIAEKYWFEIPQHFPFVRLDEYIVMPNHIHGIVIINKQGRDAKYCVSTKSKNSFGSQSENLPSVVRGFKSAVTTWTRNNNQTFMWQPGYYDHIIRNELSLNNIRQYIKTNPSNWSEDTYNAI